MSEQGQVIVFLVVGLVILTAMLGLVVQLAYA
jgi:hypothetical protein